MNLLAKSSHYKPDLQGLRAVAVGLVIYYHSGLIGLPGGYIGVDIFFVISGYLITGLLLREIERESTISLSAFYARRIRRLLPAASVVLLVTVAVAWHIYSPLALKQFASTATATAVYLSNFWFIHLSTDYLAEGTGANPLLHTWSLGVEEQFYLIWPLIILAAFGAGKAEHARHRFLAVIVSVGLISFFASLWLTNANQPVAFFSSPTRAWEFAVGGGIAFWFSRGRMVQAYIAHASSYLGLCLVLAGATLFDRKTAFPGAAALLPVFGTALLIWASHGERQNGVNKFLSTRLMQWIGDLSYSLYLWHWPVFIFLNTAGDGSTIVSKIISVAIVFALSWATLMWVENPVRYRRFVLISPTRMIGAGGALVVLSLIATLTSWVMAAQELKSPTQKGFAAATHDDPRIYDDGCHVDQFRKEPSECVYGDLKAEFVVVLFGDSHAAQWFPAVERLALVRKWRVVPVTKSGCPSINLTPFSPLLGRYYTECTAWRAAAVRKIQSLKPNLLLISNSAFYNSVTKEGDIRSLWREGLETILQEIVHFSERTIIIRDVPKLQFNAPDCLSRALWLEYDPAKSCTIGRPQERDELAFEGLKQAASVFPTVRIIDMSEAICKSQPCSVIEGELVKYKDSNHLSNSYSTYLAPELGRELPN